MQEVTQKPVSKYQQSGAYKWFVLFMLTLTYAFNFIDRQIIGILSPFIKADLGLDDAQLGWLKGFFFALLYTFVGLPLAWLADRFHRVNMLSVCLAIWSGFTAASGLATNYVQLALARVGVGIGEAGGSPPAHSIISDLFPSTQRATALAWYSMGIPVGIMLAYLASALFVSGASANWRVLMVAVGLPGILLALLVKCWVQEPERENVEPGKSLSFAASLRTLLSYPAWWGMVMGISLASFSNYAINTWIIDYYSRAFEDIPLRDILFAFAAINGTLYAASVLLGGVIADRWGRKDKRAYALLPAMTLCIGTPSFVVAMTTDHIGISLGALTVLMVSSGVYFGPSFAVAQTLAPPNVRATSTALFFFILNMIALGGGPTFTGILSNALTVQLGEQEALRQAMLWLTLPLFLSVLVFTLTSRVLPSNWQQATRGTDSSS